MFRSPCGAESPTSQTLPIVHRKDEDKFGKCRTKYVVLSIYDSIQVSIATGATYRTVLDPPPADPRLLSSATREHMNVLCALHESNVSHIESRRSHCFRKYYITKQNSQI